MLKLTSITRLIRFSNLSLTNQESKSLRSEEDGLRSDPWTFNSLRILSQAAGESSGKGSVAPNDEPVDGFLLQKPRSWRNLRQNFQMDTKESLNFITPTECDSWSLPHQFHLPRLFFQKRDESPWDCLDLSCMNPCWRKTIRNHCRRYCSYWHHRYACCRPHKINFRA